MSETPTQGQGAEATRVIYTGDEPNPFLSFVQRPRIMLIMLAAWSVLSVFAQVLTNSNIFLDAHNIELDGALGGFAFGFEGIPLAAVYIYALRDPLRHKPVFLLALIHMGAMAASQVYHLGTGDFSFESVAVPLIGSAALGALVFLHIFSSRSDEEVAERAARR